MKRMTVEEFVDRFYKPDRLAAEPGRRERIIADRRHDLRAIGETLISRHDSVTGHTVWLMAPRSTARGSVISEREDGRYHLETTT